MNASRAVTENPARAADSAAAIGEYETAVELAPKDKKTRLALATACIAARNVQKARQVLEALLKLDPEHVEAKELLKSLEE